MAIETFGIPLAYLIITSLLLWVTIAFSGRWWIKALIITLVLFFGIGLWMSLVSLQGWPVQAALPARFEIKWLLAEEPDKVTGDSGALYVWAKDLDPQGSQKNRSFLDLHRKTLRGEPRIYRLPYTRSLHEQSEEIRAEIMAGGRFFGTLARAGIQEAGAGGGRARGTGTSVRKALSPDGEEDGPAEAGLTSHQDYIFHKLPPPRIPEKKAP